MKKIISIFLLLCVIFTFASCGGKDKDTGMDTDMDIEAEDGKVDTDNENDPTDDGVIDSTPDDRNESTSDTAKDDVEGTDGSMIDRAIDGVGDMFRGRN